MNCQRNFLRDKFPTITTLSKVSLILPSNVLAMPNQTAEAAELSVFGCQKVQLLFF